MSPSLRRLRPTDSAGLLLFRRAAGSTRAFGLERALLPTAQRFSARRYLALALAPQTWHEYWVSGTAASIESVVRAGPRAGPAVWEIRELYLRAARADDAAPLLEEIASQAAAAGALRVMLRLAGGSDVFEAACHAGYAPNATENLYRLAPGKRVRDSGSMGPAARRGLRARRPEDTHALFRLYCSATPVAVRANSGMTLTEWSDGLESAGRAIEERVLEREGETRAWVRTGRTASGRWLAVLAARDAADDIPFLVRRALDADPGMAAVSLAPEYDLAVCDALERVGFVRERVFRVLVRPLAVRITEPSGLVAATG